jgi:hypothetical protein
MLRNVRWTAVSFLAVAAIGCTSSGVIPMDRGTFLITRRSAQVGFGPPVGAKADVYREANEYCARQSMVVETIKADESPSGFAQPASFSLQFRCVPEFTSPPATGTPTKVL